MSHIEQIVIIATVSLNVGVFIGLFASRYISKRQCQQSRDQIWARIDAIMDVLTGSPYEIEIKLKQKDR